MSAPVTEARDVGYRCGGHHLLRNVSLHADAGEILALVGPNGSGKSTLLGILAGEITPTTGAVFVNGNPITPLAPRERGRMRAVVWQTPELTLPFSADEVVMIGRAPHAAGGETLRDRVIVELALLATDSRDHAGRPYPSLSGGERQRVQAARALAQVWEGPDPRLLLLDEPTSSLDLEHQHELLTLARRMADDGCAVVCALHDLNLAARYADRIAVLDEGRVRLCAPPAVALTTEVLAEVFHMNARVVPHPDLSCPLVVSIAPAGRSRGVNAAIHL